LIYHKNLTKLNWKCTTPSWPR